jgi:hypothetical protein
MRRGLLLVVAGAVLLCVPCVAGAQDTRAGAIAAEQAEKATKLAPRVPSRGEDYLLMASNYLSGQPKSFYPYFDSVYSGGGFTLGAGYRHFTGDRTNWNIDGLYSAKSYKLIEANVLSPGHASGRIDARATLGWRDATQVSFFGLGIDSPEDNKTAFRMQQAFVGGTLSLRPLRKVAISAGATFEGYTLKNPTGDLTSIEDVFTPATAPGLGANPNYIHTTISAGFDSRPAADYARRGGLYEIAHHRYVDRDETFSFERLDAEVVQHVPILRETWVLSLHGRLQTTLDDEDQVPYFLLPSLGSGSTLRAYTSWRFRDRHGLLMSADWRWIVNRLGLDMALFYDAGTVANRLDALTLGNVATNFGVGARFHGPVTTPLRIELAKGSEGLNIVFSASAAF